MTGWPSTRRCDRGAGAVDETWLLQKRGPRETVAVGAPMFHRAVDLGGSRRPARGTPGTHQGGIIPVRKAPDGAGGVADAPHPRRLRVRRPIRQQRPPLSGDSEVPGAPASAPSRTGEQTAGAADATCRCQEAVKARSLIGSAHDGAGAKWPMFIDDFADQPRAQPRARPGGVRCTVSTYVRTTDVRRSKQRGCTNNKLIRS